MNESKRAQRDKSRCGMKSCIDSRGKEENVEMGGPQEQEEEN
jgi:hypothetical protein